MLSTLLLSAALVAANDGETIANNDTEIIRVIEVGSDNSMGSVIQSVDSLDFSRPRPVDLKVPSYPRSELRRGREGWVIVSYVVNAQGDVENAVIEESSGVENFERSALDAALSSRFEPAMEDGEPVESCVNKRRYTFGLEGGSLASASYRFAHNQALSAFGAKDWDAFTQAMEALHVEERRSLYEEANYHLLNGLYQEYLGNSRSALTEYLDAIVWSNLEGGGEPFR